jgi:hypothetical protein
LCCIRTSRVSGSVLIVISRLGADEVMGLRKAFAGKRGMVGRPRPPRLRAGLVRIPRLLSEERLREDTMSWYDIGVGRTLVVVTLDIDDGG